MFSYLMRVFRTDSFRNEPVGTVGRALQWMLFHILPRRAATISVPIGSAGFVLKLPPILRHAGSTGIFVQRAHYEPLLRHCEQLIGPGDVVFDCGANQGIYTCAFARLVGPSGRVIACEPQDYAVEALRNNVHLNGFTNVQVEQVAISDRSGAAVLDLTYGPTSASIARDFGRQGTKTVQTMTLAEIAQRQQISKLDLIKMDIEGAEFSALVGGESLIAQYRPVIVMEASPHEEQWQHIVALLNRYDYKPYLFGRNGRLERITVLQEDQPDVVFLNSARR